jgi:hypothetical protein
MRMVLGQGLPLASLLLVLMNVCVASCDAFGVAQGAGGGDADSGLADAGGAPSDGSIVPALDAGSARDGGGADASGPKCADPGVVCDGFERDTVLGPGSPWTSAPVGGAGGRVAVTSPTTNSGYEGVRAGEFFVPKETDGVERNSYARVVFASTAAARSSIYVRERFWVNTLPVGSETLQTLSVESPTQDAGGVSSFVFVSIESTRTTLSQGFGTNNSTPARIGPPLSALNWVLLELTIDLAEKKATLRINGIALEPMVLTKTTPGEVKVLTGITFYGPGGNHGAFQVLVDDVLIQTRP